MARYMRISDDKVKPSILLEPLFLSVNSNAMQHGISTCPLWISCETENFIFFPPSVLDPLSALHPSQNAMGKSTIWTANAKTKK